MCVATACLDAPLIIPKGEIADGDLADLLIDLDHFISDIRDSLGVPRGSLVGFRSGEMKASQW